MYLRALNDGLLFLNPDVEFFVYTVDNLAILVVEVIEDKLFWHYFLPVFFKRIECLEVRYGKPLRYTKKRNDIF